MSFAYTREGQLTAQRQRALGCKPRSIVTWSAITKKRGTHNRSGLRFFLQARQHETELDPEMGNSPNQNDSQIDGIRDVTTFSESIKGNRKQPTEGWDGIRSTLFKHYVQGRRFITNSQLFPESTTSWKESTGSPYTKSFKVICIIVSYLSTRLNCSCIRVKAQFIIPHWRHWGKWVQNFECAILHLKAG